MPPSPEFSLDNEGPKLTPELRTGLPLKVKLPAAPPGLEKRPGPRVVSPTPPSPEFDLTKTPLPGPPRCPGMSSQRRIAWSLAAARDLISAGSLAKLLLSTRPFGLVAPLALLEGVVPTNGGVAIGGRCPRGLLQGLLAPPPYLGGNAQGTCAVDT